MKRRTKRDIGIFLGVIALIGGIAFANTQLRRRGLAEQYEELRQRLEQSRLEQGIELLRWNVVRKTKGSLRDGGTFADELMAYDGKTVHMIGFMVPIEEFRDVTKFLMLPIPIECYFCAMPPSRDVLLVELREGETAQIYKEPVLLSGTFTVHQGPDVRFFYSLQNATFKAAEEGGELTRRRLQLEHTLPGHEQDDSDSLLPGYSEKERGETD